VLLVGLARHFFTRILSSFKRLTNRVYVTAYFSDTANRFFTRIKAVMRPLLASFALEFTSFCLGCCPISWSYFSHRYSPPPKLLSYAIKKCAWITDLKSDADQLSESCAQLNRLGCLLKLVTTVKRADDSPIKGWAESHPRARQKDDQYAVLLIY
jgi:hypothetical protein